jgi:hypothetical protein
MNKEKVLKYYLTIFGLLNLTVLSFGVLLFGDLLLWTPRNIPTEIMIGSIYFAMGIVMIFCSRNPLSHKSFIDFIIIANIFHAIVMFVYAENSMHVGDALIIGAMGVLPMLFYPWGLRKFMKL